MAVTPKGVRMINNNVVQSGMALVMTDRDAMDWNHIPDGSLFIHPETGDIMIKVKGESDWIPLPDHIKKDGTLVISRDTSLHVEVFKIISIDETNHQFTYENEQGERQTKIKDENGFVFQLAGSYLPGRNHLSITFDDVLDRSAASGGIEEIDEHRFRVKEDIPVGTEVTAKYIKWVRIGNPYPRIYESQTMARLDEEDNPIDAEIGDMYLDWHATLDGLEDLSIDELMNLEIDWDQIRNKPTTLNGYGIIDAARKNHTHNISQINGLEEAIQDIMSADIDAKTLRGLMPDSACQGTANRIAVYDENGELPLSVIPSKIKNSLFVKGMIIDWFGASNTVPTGWRICDGTGGTPDLRDKFIVGAGKTYALKATGGANTVALTENQIAVHKHTATIGNDGRHRHWTMDAKHTASFDRQSPGVNNSGQDIYYGDDGRYNGNVIDAYTSYDGTHNHTVSVSNSGGGQAHENRPPYYALFKIMYVGV